MRKHILKKNHLPDAEKKCMKELFIVDIQQNELASLEMKQVIMKQIIHLNYQAKITPAIENWYNKLENSQPRIENPFYIKKK